MGNPIPYWNYRVIRYKDVLTGIRHEVREVYYDENGPTTWSMVPAVVVGEGVDDLAWTLDRMSAAFRKPVLEEQGDRLVEVSEE